MTLSPRELVLGAVVKKVTVSMVQGQPNYRALVSLPDGSEYRISTRSARFERKVCKKAGLKMTTKAAKAAAQGLRDVVSNAVEAFKADPDTSNKMNRATFRASVNATKKAERERQARAAFLKEQILAMMVELRISFEDMQTIWEKSVVTDVMTSWFSRP